MQPKITALPHDLVLLRQIVLWLHRTQEILERESQSALSSKERDLYATIASHWRKIESERALDETFADSKGSLSGTGNKSRYVYLTPTLRDKMIPILSFSYSWNSSMPQVSLRVGLFLFDSQKNLAAIGYRFESPHGLGEHHFYHAQLIRTFGQDLFPQCPDWLPERQPSFALDASDPITLIICLLISLYGFDYIETLRTAPFGNALTRYMETMMLMNPAFQPRFWQVELPKETQFYMSRHQPEKFKLIMKSKGARASTSISRREYYAQAEKKRKAL